MTAINEQISQISAMLSNDPFSVSNSDNPSSSLTPVLFNGENFISWSRQLQLGLGTKMKLGFIDGSIVRPEDEQTVAFGKWLRCDRLVACWLISSMTPEIGSSFVYSTTAHDLWREIQERYSQNNASLLYQIKMESMRIVQGNLSVTSYYNKLKKCWDDIQCMNSIPACLCGFMSKCTCKILARIHELEAQDRLLHFLINLNPEYDVTKNQILSSVPVPSLSSAYQIVLQVEKQKQMCGSATSGSGLEPVAFLAGAQAANSGVQSHGGSSYVKKDGRKSGNGHKLCTLCNMKGHTSDSCFEVIGYPDWYKGKKGKRGGTFVASAMQEETPLHISDNVVPGKYSNLDPEFVSSIYQEMMKMFKGGFAGPSES